MAEPQEDRSVLFYEPDIINLKICEIGYNDFRVKKPTKLLHIRDSYIIHFVRNGSGTLQIEQNSYKVNSGEFFLVPAGVPMRYYPDPQDPWRYFWFSLSDNAARHVAEKLNISVEHPVHMAVSPMEITQIFDELLNTYADVAQYYYLALSALMKILSIQSPKSTAVSAQRNTEQIINSVIQIIKLNYTDPEFSIEAVAKSLYISHSYMCKIFKERMNCTPIAYLIDLRLEAAAKKLLDRNVTVKELCNMVGFNDEPHFMKRFKLKYGMTVRAYKAKHKQET